MLIRVLQPGFFSRKDTVTPTVLAGISVVVNIAVSLLLFPSLQSVGIALATSISAWINVAGLGILLARRGHFQLTLGELRRHGLILLAALVMGATLVLFSNRAAAIFAAGGPLLFQIGALAAICLFCSALFFALVHFSGAQPLGAVLSRLRRRRA